MGVAENAAHEREWIGEEIRGDYFSAERRKAGPAGWRFGVQNRTNGSSGLVTIKVHDERPLRHVMKSGSFVGDRESDVSKTPE